MLVQAFFWCFYICELKSVNEEEPRSCGDTSYEHNYVFLRRSCNITFIIQHFITITVLSKQLLNLIPDRV